MLGFLLVVAILSVGFYLCARRLLDRVARIGTMQFTTDQEVSPMVEAALHSLDHRPKWNQLRDCLICGAQLRADEWERHTLTCICLETMMADGPVTRYVQSQGSRDATPAEGKAFDAMQKRLQQEKIRRWRDRFNTDGRGEGTYDDPLGPPWDTRGDSIQLPPDDDDPLGWGRGQPA